MRTIQNWVNLARFYNNALGFLEDQWRNHGDLHRFPFGGFEACLAVHPALVRQVLQSDHALYRKGPDITRLTPAVVQAFGGGLLLSDGVTWLRNRRMVQPAFHRSAIHRYGSLISSEAENMLDEWEDGPVELFSMVSRLTMALICRMMFSWELEELGAFPDAVATVIDDLNQRLFGPPLHLPLQLPTPANRRFAQAMRVIDETIVMTLERRKEEEEMEDIFSLLVQTKDRQTGSYLSHAELRDEVVNLFAAGYETSAVSIVWTLALLSAHPEWEARVVEEVRSVVGHRVATVDDQLPLLDRVVREVMRLRPAAWMWGRHAQEPVKLGSTALEKDTLVLMVPWLTHRHPDFWEDPDRFDPDRWLPERSGDRDRFSWLPFGGGPRGCIGQGLALMEQRIVLASILGRWKVDFAEDPLASPMLTLMPKPPVRVRLTPRDGAFAHGPRLRRAVAV